MSKEAVLLLAQKEGQWLKEKRLAAWESFSSSVPLPFYRYGLNIITPLEGMAVDSIETEGNQIEYSAIPPLKVQDSPADKRIFSLLPDDRFSHLHRAFSPVLHIKVPDNTELSQPFFIQRRMQSKTCFDHLFIEVGKNCKLAILESIEGGGSYHSGGVEIFLGEGSSLLFGSKQSLSPAAHHFSVKNAVLQNNARLEWVTIDTGSSLALSRVNALLQGQGSSVSTKMMVFGTQDQHFDFNVSSIHAAPDTRSDIVEKAVLDGRAKMVFSGLVKIQNNAPRSNGYQKEDTLLLSSDAEAAPIPSLEIDNNDVRCSHGTTVGQIDKEMLFYLLSRGLDEESATRLVVKGFFDPLISTLPLPSLQEEVRSIVESRLEERRA